MTKSSRILLATAMVAASITISLCVLGIAGEVVIRYREGHRSDVPGTMPLIFYPHVREGHALVHGSRYYRWVRVNSAGFRGADVSLVKPPGVVRIAAVGSSTTFDSFVSADSCAWTVRLQYWLNKLQPNTPVEVINAGVAGYDVSNDIYRLDTDVAPYRPDVILEFQGGADLNESLSRAVRRGLPAEVSNTPDEVQRITPWGYWLARHSLFYNKVLEEVTVITHARRGAAANAAAPDTSVVNARVRDGLGRFERDLAAFTTIGTMLGARVVLLQPVTVSGLGATIDTSLALKQSWKTSMYIAPLSRTLDGYQQVRAAIDRVGQRQGVPIVTAEQLGVSGLQYFAEGDPVHFNDAGADLMGKHLAEALIASGVLAPNHASAATAAR